MKGFNRLVTIRDVANKAKVSPATVSLVLNKASQSLPISEATRLRVLEAARILGYQPNSFAQALRRNKSRTVAVLAFDIIDPYCAHVMRGAEEVIDDKGYYPMLCDLNNDERKMKRYISLFLQRRVEGLLILASSLKLEDQAIFELRSHGIPLVVIGREVQDAGVPTIVNDNVGGTYLAVEHLLGLGHRKISFILGPSKYIDSQQRREGGIRALRDHGMQAEEKLTIKESAVGWGPEAGYCSMKKILRTGESFTAVSTFDDISAFGAIRAITEAGLRVPDDISVVGFDDLPAAAFYNPPLTTVHNSMVEMGRQGAEMLHKLIAGGGSGNPAMKVLSKNRLVVRKSTAPPGGRRET
jgi:DNA-binding LacI/PurR family transcriptional regulator